jgi:hypothetical protein
MKIKVILTALFVASLLVIAWLTADLMRAKKQLADSAELIEIQHELINKLGSMDAINATINVEVHNKATFGSVKAGDVEIVADQVLRYTRRELLKSDTLCTNTLR